MTQENLAAQLRLMARGAAGLGQSGEPELEERPTEERPQRHASSGLADAAHLVVIIVGLLILAPLFLAFIALILVAAA